MKRGVVILSLVLLGVGGGCTVREDVQGLRSDMTAIERQRTRQEKAVEQQLIGFGERLARLEQSQTEVRHDLAQAVATLQELQVEQQRLRGTMQETQYRLKRGAPPDASTRDAFATKLAELSTRLVELENRLSPTAPSSTSPTTSSQPSSSTAGPTTMQPSTMSASRPPAPSLSAPPALPTTSDMPADSLYKRALQEYQQGNYEVATVLFKQYLREHPKESLAGHAQYWLGEALYAQKQFEAAIVAFDEVIRKYPDNSKVPASLLKQGFAFAELKDVRNARFFLDQVQKKFPNTPEAQQATEKLRQL